MTRRDPLAEKALYLAQSGAKDSGSDSGRFTWLMTRIALPAIIAAAIFWGVLF